MLISFPPLAIQIVFGDSARLQQILLNLLANGTKFTHQGFIRVAINARPLFGADGARFVEDRAGVGLCAWYEIEMSITDTGIGISDKMLARLFKPFNQGDSSVARKYGGTGNPPFSPLISSYSLLVLPLPPQNSFYIFRIGTCHKQTSGGDDERANVGRERVWERIHLQLHHTSLLPPQPLLHPPLALP